MVRKKRWSKKRTRQKKIQQILEKRGGTLWGGLKGGTRKKDMYRGGAGGLNKSTKRSR